MTDYARFVVAGHFNDGCLVTLDDDGVPTAFWRPEGFTGEGSFFEVQYGPSPTNCSVSWTDPSGNPHVYLFDVVAQTLTKVEVPLPDFDGYIVQINLLSADGRDADVLIEKAGSSYARLFLLRIRNGKVSTKKNIPIHCAFTADHLIAVKKPKGELPRVQVLTQETGATIDLATARSSKTRLNINSLSPDRSMLLVQECEWTNNLEKSRQTDLTLFDVNTGANLASTSVSGGEAFVNWFGASHVAIQVQRTTHIFTAPELARLGQTSNWLIGGGAVRDERIWWIETETGSVLSAPLQGGPSKVHHQFGPNERPGMGRHSILALASVQ